MAASVGDTVGSLVFQSRRKKEIDTKHNEISKCWKDLMVLRKALYHAKSKNVTLDSLSGLGRWHFFIEIGAKIKNEMFKGMYQ